MVMPDLSGDLVEEILTRVPATSLRGLGSTCKRWNSLFKEPSFSETHFRRAPKQPRVFMLKEFRIFPMSVDLNVVPPSIEFKDALVLKDPRSKNSEEQADIVKVFHCDGLLLCITRDNRPVVWNPCLGETRWIQRNNGYDSRGVFALGYENKQSCRSYKTLMFWRERTDAFEIYELSSNSWRVVYAPNRISIRRQGVTLKGNAYWISREYNEYSDKYLLSFDFTREEFRHLCLPPPYRNRDYKGLSVVGEEQLLLFRYMETGREEVEMWVTKNIDYTKELSWSKSFSVGRNTIYRKAFSVFTSLLIDEEKKVVLCCNSWCWFSRNKNQVVYTIGEDDKYYSEVPCRQKPLVHIGAGWWWPLIFNYVPSLVHIQ